MFMVKVPWSEAAKSLVIPSLRWDKDYLTTVVAVLGTTISPYLFFWQASQEAEDVRTVPARQILKRAPRQGEGALNRIHLDTFVGMGFSNFIALAIMITAADLGIGTGHSAVGDQNLARRLLGFPDDHLCAYLIALGHPAERPLAPLTKINRRPFDEVVHRGHW